MAKIQNEKTLNILTSKLYKVTKSAISPQRKLGSCTLTTNNFPQGWDNWAAKNPDPKIREDSARVMAHSKEIQDVHYRVTEKLTAVRVAAGPGNLARWGGGAVRS